MVLATSPYHHAAPIRAERGIKLAAGVLAAALHLLALYWLQLHTHLLIPPATDTAMMLVEMHLPTPQAAISSKRNEPGHVVHYTHAPAAAAFNRKPVAQGTLAPGAGDQEASASSLAIPTGGGSARTAFIPPRVLHRGTAAYPFAAIQAHQEGEATVLVTIAADGSLIDASISTSTGSEALDRASIEAIRRYTFKAAQKGGLAIEAQAYVSLGWKITPTVVNRFRVEFPQDSRQSDVEKTKDTVNMLSGHVVSHH